MAANPNIIRLKYSADSEASIIAAIEPGASHPITRGELVIGTQNGFAKLYTLDSNDVPVAINASLPSNVDGGDFDLGSYSITEGSRLPLLGVNPAMYYPGWARVVNAVNTTTSYQPSMQFDFPFNGSTYNSFYVNKNSFITFGADPLPSSFSEGSPAVNKIFIEPATGYIQRIYVQSNSAYCRVRFEGDATLNTALGSSDLIYEITFINPALTTNPLIELRTSGTGYTNRNGLFMIASPTTALAQAPDMLVGESWVFEGNADGTAWTMHDYSHINIQAHYAVAYLS